MKVFPMRFRKPLCALLIGAALLGPLSPALAADPAQDEKVSLNFANAEIDSVIRAIGKISGRNFLVDPRVKGTLNIVTNTPVPRSMTYDILLSALRLQGYTAVESRGVTKIVPEADAKLQAVPLGKPNARGNEGVVTRVFNLKYESAAQMLPVIRPLVPPNNMVTAFPGNNTLVVTDYADNVERIARIIDSIDVPQGGVMVLELQHAAASDLAETVSKVMATGNGAAGQPGAGADASQWVQIVPDNRTNSLLVRADSPAKLTTVRRLVAELDRPGASGNIHVIYLKNASATEVAKTLSAVISGEGGSQGGKSASTAYSDKNSSSLGKNSTSSSTSSSSSSSGSSASAGLGSGASSTRFSREDSSTGGGIVQADANNNALIITAPEAIYNNLRQVVDQLDRRRVQVYVEALIAEISSERASEIGIQWNGTSGGTNFGGTGQNILSAMADPTSVGTGLNLIMGAGSMTIPVNGTDVKVTTLSMLARFMENDTKTNILSTPNLITLDNEEAQIMVGQNVPFVTGNYTTSASTGTTNPFQTIERQDVGLTLHIRPQVSEGGSIRLDIYQESSSVVSTTTSSTTGPTTNKRSIDTSVLVDDGSIIALGGLIEDSYSGGVEKVPLLGDIPYLGTLFRYDTRKRTKTNLVVFLRPMILRDKDSYGGLTSSRYDYVLGQQRATATRRDLMRKEPFPAEMPAFGSTPPAVPVNRAQVGDAEIQYLGSEHK